MGRQLHALSNHRPHEVRLIYRHCPSRRHPVGRLAALVAAAADELGRFWDLHWDLVREGPIETEEMLWEAVRRVDLDEADIRSIIASGRPEQVVVRDLAIADQNGVRGMPTTFINGRIVEGAVSLERLNAIIDEAVDQR
jgi:protein-disulfide isomerase